MKLKQIVVLVLIPCSIGVANLGCREEPVAAAEPAEALATPDQVSALVTLIGDLAAERYAANSEKQEQWILSVGLGSTPVKHTDGKFILARLPASSPAESCAMASYVNQYNSFNVRAADLLTRSGKYEQALEICRLVARFGPEGAHITELAQDRVSLLTKVIRNEDRESTLAELEQLFVDYRSKHDFSLIRTGAPNRVISLLELGSK